MAPHLSNRNLNLGLLWLSVVLIVDVLPNVWCTCYNGQLLESSLDEDPPINDDLKNKIVSAHNFHRSCVALQNAPDYCWKYGTVTQQPGASQMLEMVWDDLLGELAQNVVNSCHEGGLNQAYHPDFPEGLGYNTYTTTSNRDKSNQYAEPPVEFFLSKWFNENENYTYHSMRPGECFQRINTCQYSQMVSASTYKVGCGYSYYKRSRSSRFPYVQFFVCFYGPLGNYSCQTPYRKGPAICKKGSVKSKSFPGLCRGLKGYKTDESEYNCN